MTCLLLTLYSFVFLFLFSLCWYLPYKSSLCAIYIISWINLRGFFFCWHNCHILCNLLHAPYFVRICFILIIEFICFSGTTSSKLLSNVSDNAQNRQWVDCPLSLQWIPKEQENKNLTESTSGVPAKDPLKVKLVNEKFLRTLSWES